MQTDSNICKQKMEQLFMSLTENIGKMLSSSKWLSGYLPKENGKYADLPLFLYYILGIGYCPPLHFSLSCHMKIISQRRILWI